MVTSDFGYEELIYSCVYRLSDKVVKIVPTVPGISRNKRVQTDKNLKNWIFILATQMHRIGCVFYHKGTGAPNQSSKFID